VIVNLDRKPIGIVTERDFMRRLINNSLDPVATPLSAIMTTDLKLARAEDNLLDWLRQMSNERFRHLPVVDDDGRLVSIMSQGDFVSYTWPELMGRVREQAQATFAINPSMITAGIVGIILLLGAILAVLANS
jgi:CBS-domain-containing membrane protein